jgi:hypothetical protein
LKASANSFDPATTAPPKDFASPLKNNARIAPEFPRAERRITPDILLAVFEISSSESIVSI